MQYMRHASQLPKDEGFCCMTGQPPLSGERRGIRVMRRGGQDMRLVNLDTGAVLAERVEIASTFWKRLRGLMFTSGLAGGTGLYLQPCRSVHTFFMKYSIDVIHLDDSFRIVGLEHSIKPGQIGSSYHGTASIVELPEGMIVKTCTAVGQAVQFEREEKEDVEQN
jgi:uncharacterized protein